MGYSTTPKNSAKKSQSVGDIWFLWASPASGWGQEHQGTPRPTFPGPCLILLLILTHYYHMGPCGRACWAGTATVAQRMVPTLHEGVLLSPVGDQLQGLWWGDGFQQETWVVKVNPVMRKDHWPPQRVCNSPAEWFQGGEHRSLWQLYYLD